MRRGGDTPAEQTLFKYKIGGTNYCIGKIVPKVNGYADIGIYAPDNEHFYVISEQGTCIANSGTLNETLRLNIADACENTIGIQAEYVLPEIKVITVGSEIENWDEYQLIMS